MFLDALAMMQSGFGMSKATPRTAIQNATVYSCIRVLSHTMASVPVILYKKQGATRERAVDHPLYPLLSHSPNEFQTSHSFVSQWLNNVCLRGNFYAHIVRVNGGRIMELLPINPDLVQLKQDKRKVYYEISEDGAQKAYEKENILHIFDLTQDGLRGISPIDHAAQSVTLAMQAEKFGNEYFAGTSRYSGVLEVPHELGDEAFAILKESWNEGAKSGGTAILEAGTTFKPIAMTNEQSQFLDTRKYQRSEICGLYGVPPHMIGDLERATFSNIEHQSIEFVTRAILPRARAAEQAMNMRLLTEKERAQGYYVEFLLDGLLRGDALSRAQANNIYLQNGVVNPNEVRARENLNPYPGGDVYMRPLNMSGNNGETPNG